MKKSQIKVLQEMLKDKETVGECALVKHINTEI